MKDRKNVSCQGISPRKIQFACLLLLGVAEFLLVTVSPLRPWLGEYMVQSYLVVPALVFLGASLTTELTFSGVRALLAGTIITAWIVLAKCAQQLAWEGPANYSMWWAAYLMAFPFAAVVRDGKTQSGLKLMAIMSVAVSAVMSVCSFLLILDGLPRFLSEAVQWDNEGRLVAMGHPNISGWLFMMGISFTLGFSFLAKKRWCKIALAAAAAVQLAVQSLTNSRTTTLMTCAVVAGVVFFYIYRGGWKRFVLGALAAVMVLGGLFKLSDVIYKKNYERLTAPASVQQEERERSSPSQANEDTVEQLTKRNSFLHDLKTFTGRTGIWKAAFKALRDEPVLLLRGTEHVSAAIEEGGNPFGVLHSHNSWIEMLVGFGVPGLLLALYFTFLAVRGSLRVLFSWVSSMWQKSVSLLVLCMLVAGILEPFLFTGYLYCQFPMMIFFLCTGYLDQWQEELRRGA